MIAPVERAAGGAEVGAVVGATLGTGVGAAVGAAVGTKVTTFGRAAVIGALSSGHVMNKRKCEVRH